MGKRHHVRGSAPARLDALIRPVAILDGFGAYGRLRSAAQVSEEPVAGQLRDSVERSRLLEQMTGPGYDLQTVFAPQLGLGLAVEIEHKRIVPAHDQQGRRLHSTQMRGGEVGSPSPGNDRPDLASHFDSSDQRRGRTRRRSEEPEVHSRPRPGEPPRGREQSFGEETDVEDQSSVHPLVRREQIEAQRPQTRSIE